MLFSSLSFVLIVTLVILLVYVSIIYLLPWFNRRRIAAFEMPAAWERVLNDREEFMHLSEDKKERIRTLVKIFMAEKYFEPDELGWDQQIKISAIIALKIHDSRHKYLSKLSTIRISNNHNSGQGFLEVTSIENLNDIDFKKWF